MQAVKRAGTPRTLVAPPPPASKAARWQLIAAFAALYLIWGSTYLAIRFALETLPPLLMAGARFLIAGSILYGAVRLRGTPRPQPVHWRAAAVAGALLMAVGNGGVVWAEQRVPSGLTAVLVTTMPLWLALLDWRLYGVRLTSGAVIGLLLGFLGVALLVGPGAFGGNAVDPLGALVLSLAALGWAAGAIYSRTASLPPSALLATALELLCGGALLLAAGLLAGEWAHVSLAAVSARSALAVAYLIIFGSLAGFSAFSWLLRHAPASQVATYAYVNPVVAVLLGWALAGERFTPLMMLAAAIILAGVFMILRLGASRRYPAPD